MRDLVEDNWFERLMQSQWRGPTLNGKVRNVPPEADFMTHQLGMLNQLDYRLREISPYFPDLSMLFSPERWTGSFRWAIQRRGGDC